MVKDIQREVIDKRELPNLRVEALEALLSADGTKYTFQEGLHWDFKKEWPFSYSDEYFGGIARLICAFANTFGGLIIFGVDDDKRTAGHNKVIPKVDRLQQALDHLLSRKIELIFRRYDEGTSNEVDVLLVPPLPIDAMPVRFKTAIGKYYANVIWIRQGHEVVVAETRHVPILYCRASSADENSQEDLSLSGLLPPSPSTISTFVGRLATIDKIFGWIKQSDEPRNFLYGKGGSGKTTIAYQVAKTLRLHGGSILLAGTEHIDNVVFVMAKQVAVNTISGQQSNYHGVDFTNEREL